MVNTFLLAIGIASISSVSVFNQDNIKGVWKPSLYRNVPEGFMVAGTGMGAGIIVHSLKAK
jgi:hypothetical protein